MHDWSDKRHFRRYQLHLPFLHRGMAPTDIRTGVGWTHDLSEGGACVELPEHLRTMQPVRVRFRMDHGTIEAEANVVWKAGVQTVWAGESGPVEGGVLHGITFTRLASDQLQVLRALLLFLNGVQHPRVRLPLEAPALCQPQEEGSAPLQGWAGDVSRGGLLIRLSHKLPPGTMLAIRLKTHNGPLEMEGAVVWAESPEGQAPTELIRHGIRFTAIGWYTLLSLGLLLTVLR